jgi:hypothetical protein
VRECPKILKICQITKFDMGFQKNNMRSRFERFYLYIYTYVKKFISDLKDHLFTGRPRI